MIPTAVSWHYPPQNAKKMIMDRSEVHVWRADLDWNESMLSRMYQTLAGDERARAARFHFQNDRDRFVLRRGLLRAILGLYLDLEPDQLKFLHGPNGKPALARETGGDRLHFNLTHSQGLALFAITYGRELGIDLEHLDPNVALEEIAETFFSSEEVQALHTLPKSERQHGFLVSWTRKEAYLKATGEGLSVPLDEVQVSSGLGYLPKYLRTGQDRNEVSRWSIKALAPGPEYVASLCVEGNDWRLSCWDWPSSKRVRGSASQTTETAVT